MMNMCNFFDRMRHLVIEGFAISIYLLITPSYPFVSIVVSVELISCYEKTTLYIINVDSIFPVGDFYGLISRVYQNRSLFYFEIFKI